QRIENPCVDGSIPPLGTIIFNAVSFFLKFLLFKPNIWCSSGNVSFPFYCTLILNGYHKHGISENAMYCLKQLFGTCLSSCSLATPVGASPF
ncbi:MAG: hypothetical protein WCL34_07360, partial [Methylococcaceae bacterium]